jgi:hypothetical protein
VFVVINAVDIMNEVIDTFANLPALSRQLWIELVQGRHEPVEKDNPLGGLWQSLGQTLNQVDLTSFHFVPPNGWRLSGDGGVADGVRCSRGLDDARIRNVEANGTQAHGKYGARLAMMGLRIVPLEEICEARSALCT